MPRLTPVSRHELIARLKNMGFEGPYSGGKQQLMVRGYRRVIIRNVHQSDIGVDLLKRVLHQADVSRDEWEKAK